MHTPQPKIYGYGQNVHLWHFPLPKRVWPKCLRPKRPRPKCPCGNVLHSLRSYIYIIVSLIFFSSLNLQSKVQNSSIGNEIWLGGGVDNGWPSSPPPPVMLMYIIVGFKIFSPLKVNV